MSNGAPMPFIFRKMFVATPDRAGVLDRSGRRRLQAAPGKVG
jgi:hypothetical protein